jgi:hypothetical protein
MRQYRKTATVALLAASTACALGALAGPANAAAQTQTEHSSFDPTGAVFSCQGGDLTVQPGGVVDEVDHFTVDAHGDFHFTGTLTPHNVTLTDADNNLYTLSGADWFGGTGTPDGNPVVETDTSHFVIHNADGSVYAKVQVVDHLSPNGHSFTFDRGACEAPQD